MNKPGLNISAVFLLFFCLTVTSTTINAEDKSVVKVITELVDNNDFVNAKQEIDEQLLENPDATAVRYQLARYYLRKESITNDSIIGYDYPDVAAGSAIAELDKVLKEDAGYVEAYSLLGHIYAVLNKPKKAAYNFEKAEDSYDRPAWLDVNKAILAIQKKEFSEAAALLKEYTAVRPGKNDYVENRVYSSAWDLLRKLSVQHPELDPVPAIRKGLIKRVLAEDYLEYVESTAKSEKPAFIHFASSDNWCKPCAASLKRIEGIARKHGDKFDFIHVSFEPWNNVSYYKDVVDSAEIKGLPSREIVSKGRSQAHIAGVLADSSVERITGELYEDLKAGRIADKK